MKNITVLTLLCLLAMISCSNEKHDEKHNGVIPQYQLDALEKAKGIEKQLLETDIKVRNKIQETLDKNK